MIDGALGWPMAPLGRRRETTVFPMLVCESPEAEMEFCAAAFGAHEHVRRPGPDGAPIHIAMRINGAFLVA